MEQAAVLVSREGIPVALTTVDASDQGIDRIVWILRPSKLAGVSKSGQQLGAASGTAVAWASVDALLRRPTHVSLGCRTSHGDVAQVGFDTLDCQSPAGECGAGAAWSFPSRHCFDSLRATAG
jgi:hypothetical protein